LITSAKQQDQPADQHFQERVDWHVVEAVVEHAQYEQADNGVADPAATAEQARCRRPPPRDRVEQVRA
jgi:hypothetical protein